MRGFREAEGSDASTRRASHTRRWPRRCGTGGSFARSRARVRPALPQRERGRYGADQAEQREPCTKGQRFARGWREPKSEQYDPGARRKDGKETPGAAATPCPLTRRVAHASRLRLRWRHALRIAGGTLQLLPRQGLRHRDIRRRDRDQPGPSRLFAIACSIGSREASRADCRVSLAAWPRETRAPGARRAGRVRSPAPRASRVTPAHRAGRPRWVADAASSYLLEEAGRSRERRDPQARRARARAAAPAPPAPSAHRTYNRPSLPLSEREREKSASRSRPPRGHPALT